MMMPVISSMQAPKNEIDHVAPLFAADGQNRSCRWA